VQTAIGIRARSRTYKIYFRIFSPLIEKYFFGKIDHGFTDKNFSKVDNEMQIQNKASKTRDVSQLKSLQYREKI
jgi:hypothetical protein